MADLRTEGLLQRMRGKIKETWGGLTDDDLDKTEGKLEMLVGVIKQKTGETEDSIRSHFERWMKEDETSATTDR